MANAPSGDTRLPPPSPSSDIGQNVSSAKPAQRFLIGVLLALFTILGVCFIFLLKPYVERSLRRLQNQREDVDICIQKRRRRRRPRLHEIWIDLHQIAQTMGRQTPDDGLDWRISHKPLAVSLDHHSSSTCSEQPANAANGRTDPSACGTNLSTPNKSTLRGFDLFEPLPDSTPLPDETKHPCEPPEILDFNAQVCFLIAFPSPATSRHFPFPTRSPCRTRSSTPIPNRDSETQNGENGLLVPSHAPDTGEIHPSSLPSGLCLGISCSSIAMYP